MRVQFLPRCSWSSPVHRLLVQQQDRNYSYSTLADPGAKPTTGGITIKDNIWAYDDSSFESNGKKAVIRVTNEFTNPKTEVLKVVSSEDDGATWKTMLQGVARKVGD
jgi:hypothetical protein